MTKTSRFVALCDVTVGAVFACNAPPRDVHADHLVPSHSLVYSAPSEPRTNTSSVTPRAIAAGGEVHRPPRESHVGCHVPFIHRLCHNVLSEPTAKTSTVFASDEQVAGADVKVIPVGVGGVGVGPVKRFLIVTFVGGYAAIHVWNHEANLL